MDIAKAMSTVLLEVDWTDEFGADGNGVGVEPSVVNGGIITVTVTVIVLLTSVVVIVVVPINAPAVS